MQYLLHNKDNNALEMTYEATTDKTTPINLTNHTYWNLNGCERTVHDHTLSLNCSKFLPVTATQIPTGETRDVKGICPGILFGVLALCVRVRVRAMSKIFATMCVYF